MSKVALGKFIKYGTTPTTTTTKTTTATPMTMVNITIAYDMAYEHYNSPGSVDKSHTHVLKTEHSKQYFHEHIDSSPLMCSLHIKYNIFFFLFAILVLKIFRYKKLTLKKNMIRYHFLSYESIHILTSSGFSQTRMFISCTIIVSSV